MVTDRLTPMTRYAGQLLVATPQLVDPNFRRTVVLLLDHDDNGALGVTINRPTEVLVEQILPTWGGAVSEPQALFEGGPVGAETALAVAQTYDDDTLPGFQRLSGGLGLVDLDADPADLAGHLIGVRVFAGHAGWGPEQLDNEIEEGSWYVVPATPTDLSDTEPLSLWRRVLRRQPGELAFVASIPDDPTLN